MEVSNTDVQGCLLLCPLEGCKQSAFLYQKAVRLQMTHQNAKQSMTEPNIYYVTANDCTIRIAVYVDNMLIGNDPTEGSRNLRK